MQMLFRRTIASILVFVLAVPVVPAQPRVQTASGWNDPRFAPALTDPVARRCDELADSTSDTQRVGAGVPGGSIDHAHALPACREAAARKPERARYQWLYGRVLIEMGGHDEEAAQQFELARRGGYGAASYMMSELARVGAGMPKDEARAAAYMREAAERGIPEAMYHMGHRFQHGEGVDRDEAQAQAWYERAGDAGIAEAYTAIGDLLKYNYPKLQESADWYRRGAQAGSAIGAYQLAFMYESGVGGRFTKDELMAEKLYRQAADAKMPEAMYRLANLYATGRGKVKRFDYGAYQWYRAAAEQEHAWLPGEDWLLADARVQVGLMLYNGGDRLPRDPRAAAQWLSKSMQGNISPSAEPLQLLGAMYDAGDGVERNPVQAVRYFRMAAESGYPFSMTALGYHLRDGIGVAKNEPEAAQWFRKAADTGYPAAEAALGYGYMSTAITSGPHDDRIAAQWLERAAQQGEPSAQVNLGWLYANGLGVPRDVGRAKGLWQQAAASDNAFYANAARANLQAVEPQPAAASRDAERQTTGSRGQDLRTPAQDTRATRQDGRPAESPLVRHRDSDGSISTGAAVVLAIGGAVLLSMLMRGSSSSAPASTTTSTTMDSTPLYQKWEEQKRIDDAWTKLRRTGTADCWYAVGCAHQK